MEILVEHLLTPRFVLSSSHTLIYKEQQIRKKKNIRKGVLMHCTGPASQHTLHGTSAFLSTLSPRASTHL
jgi:hypothetical protein